MIKADTYNAQHDLLTGIFLLSRETHTNDRHATEPSLASLDIIQLSSTLIDDQPQQLQTLKKPTKKNKKKTQKQLQDIRAPTPQMLK